MANRKIDSHLVEARSRVAHLQRSIGLTTVVLDNWRGAIRLVYGGPNTPECPAECAQCRLFQAVGLDDPEMIKPDETDDNRLNFVATLNLPRDSDRLLAPRLRRCLNCMTLGQYANFYIAWFLNRANSEDEIREELELVSGFRLVYHRGATKLDEVETAAKRIIVESVLWRLDPEDRRHSVIVKHAERLSLL